MIKPITHQRAQQIAERLQALEPAEGWTPEEVIRVDCSARHKIAGLLATRPDLKEIFRSFLAMFHKREIVSPSIFKIPDEANDGIYRPWEEEPLQAWDVADPFGT